MSIRYAGCELQIGWDRHGSVPNYQHAQVWMVAKHKRSYPTLPTRATSTPFPIHDIENTGWEEFERAAERDKKNFRLAD